MHITTPRIDDNTEKKKYSAMKDIVTPTSKDAHVKTQRAYRTSIDIWYYKK